MHPLNSHLNKVPHPPIVILDALQRTHTGKATAADEDAIGQHIAATCRLIRLARGDSTAADDDHYPATAYRS